MFTGIILATGRIHSIEAKGPGKRMQIKINSSETEQFSAFSSLKTGDSLSIDGVCSTITDIENSHEVLNFSFDYLPETLEKTALGSYEVGTTVNLEPAATLNTALGGHLVSGHIDETGTITDIETQGQFHSLQIQFSPKFAPYLIPKGSICLNGISLTIVDIDDDTQIITTHIIPHTWSETSLSEKKTRDPVHIEYDMVGKYIHRQNSLS